MVSIVLIFLSKWEKELKLQDLIKRFAYARGICIFISNISSSFLLIENIVKKGRNTENLTVVSKVLLILCVKMLAWVRCIFLV